VSDIPGNNEEVTAQDKLSVSRRWFLLKIGVAFNGLIGLALLTPVLRYLFSPLKRDAAYQSWVSIGSIDSFPVGETSIAIYKNPFNRPWDGETAGVACYVRRTRLQEFQVFAVNCAHLGCPVRWFPQSQLFMCPCHGGAYYADGARASGPPERGLFTYDFKIVEGQLQINAGQMPTLSNSAKLHQITSAKGDSPCAG
jgi:Rieske Fe-S protein